MNKNIFRPIIIILCLGLLTACASQNILLTEPAATMPVQTPILSTPSSQTIELQKPMIKLPKVILIDSNDGIGLTFIDLLGKSIAEFKTPGISFPGSPYVHIAGSIPPGQIQVPLVYFAYQPEAALIVNSNDQIEYLMKSRYFDGLAGAAGSPVIAFTFLNPKDSGLESKLFVSDLKNIPQAVAVLTQVDSQNSLSIVPLAVDARGDAIDGVWFTKRPWGIGGDIVFDPFRGLFYFDYAKKEVKEVLNENQGFQGLALDRSLAASVENVNPGQGLIKVINLSSGSITNFPMVSSSDRGAGYIEFSPDNRFMIWMEAGGFQMVDTPNFHNRIRTARLGDSPGILRDDPDTTLASALGYPSVSWLRPVGWLDNQTALIEVRQDNWEKASLVKLDVINGTLTEISKGSFVGFGYE